MLFTFIVAPPLLPWLLKKKSFCVAPSSSRWIRSSAINERNFCTSSTDNETDIFCLFKKRCAHSKQLCLILRWLCWFESNGSVASLVQVQWRRQWWFSLANQWTAEFTRHILVKVRLAWNLNRGWYWKKYQALYQGWRQGISISRGGTRGGGGVVGLGVNAICDRVQLLTLVKVCNAFHMSAVFSDFTFTFEHVQ